MREVIEFNEAQTLFADYQLAWFGIEPVDEDDNDEDDEAPKITDTHKFKLLLDFCCPWHLDDGDTYLVKVFLEPGNEKEDVARIQALAATAQKGWADALAKNVVDAMNEFVPKQ